MKGPSFQGKAGTIRLGGKSGAAGAGGWGAGGWSDAGDDWGAGSWGAGGGWGGAGKGASLWDLVADVKGKGLAGGALGPGAKGGMKGPKGPLGGSSSSSKGAEVARSLAAAAASKGFGSLAKGYGGKGKGPSSWQEDEVEQPAQWGARGSLASAGGKGRVSLPGPLQAAAKAVQEIAAKRKAEAEARAQAEQEEADAVANEAEAQAEAEQRALEELQQRQMEAEVFGDVEENVVEEPQEGAVDLEAEAQGGDVGKAKPVGLQNKGGHVALWKADGEDWRQQAHGGKGRGAGTSAAAAKVGAGEEVYSGYVKNYSVDKKHGYIVCEPILNQYGQDIYVFQDVLERGRGGPGDTVCFFIHWSARGQPQASSPLLRLACGESGQFALKGMYKPSKDSDKGFGFLECPETKDFFGRDVYICKELSGGLEYGQTVAFNCYLNRDGMPNVLGIQAVDPDWEPESSDLSVSRAVDHNPNAKGSSAKGAGAKGDWSQGAKGAAKGAWNEGGWSEGGWGDDWGWGGDSWWGISPALILAALKGGKGGKGALAALAALVADGGKGGLGKSGKGDVGKGGKGPGMAGKGIVIPASAKGIAAKGVGSAKGAEGWKGAGIRPPTKPTPTGKAYVGFIKSFNEVNNYGFIACEEVKEEFGCDTFVHGKELNGQSVGETVHFEVAVSLKGQPQAINIRSVDDAVPQPPAKRARLEESYEAGDLSGLDQMLLQDPSFWGQAEGAEGEGDMIDAQELMEKLQSEETFGEDV